MNYPNVPYPGAQRPMGQPQQFFPMPQGNVYTIERPEEISTVPCGTGVSVALCLAKNLMYIKSIQGGSPLYWVYKIAPATEADTQSASMTQPVQTSDINDRVARLEQKLDILLKGVKPDVESKPSKLVIE